MKTLKKLTFLVLALAMLISVAVLSSCGKDCEYGDWVVTKEATCTEEGERVATCTEEGCGKTKTSKIDALGHDLDADGICKRCSFDSNGTPGLEYKKNSTTTVDPITGEETSEEWYSVVGIGAATGAEIVIPSQFDGLPVRKIEENAFANNKNIRRVVIREGVTEISNWAFDGCTSLVDVKLPNGLTYIGMWAFDGCEKITEIVIPDDVLEIGEWAFRYCPLTEVSLPAHAIKYIEVEDLIEVNITSGTEIDAGAFMDCIKLERVSMPKSLKLIGNSAFQGCTSLEKVTVGEDLAILDIGSYAFCECEKLKEIDILKGVMDFGAYSFYGCTALEEVEFAKGVTVVGNYAFGDCTGIKSIEFDRSATEIASYAFSGCEALETISLPTSMEKIGAHAFEDCNAVRTVSVPTIEAWFNVYFEDLVANPLYVESTDMLTNETIITPAKLLINGSAMSGNVVIPVTCKGIPAYTFYGDNASSVTSIIVPDSIERIDADAFGEGVSNVSVKYDGTMAEWVAIEFGNGKSNPLAFGADLKINGESLGRILEIDSSIEEINSYAFYGYNGTVIIPEEVTYIGARAFRNRDEDRYGNSLGNLFIFENGTHSIGSSFVDTTFYGSIDNLLYQKNYNKQINGYEELDLLTDYRVITDDDGYDYAYVIDYTGSSKVVDIPSKYINDSYWGTTYTIQHFGMTFYNNDKIERINLTGTDEIAFDSYTFYDCDNLEEVIIPFEYTAALGSYTFAENDDLTVKYAASESYAKAHSWGDSWYGDAEIQYNYDNEITGRGTLCYVISDGYAYLTGTYGSDVYIPESVIKDGISYPVNVGYVFYENDDVEIIRLSTNTSLSQYAIRDCESLEAIYVPYEFAGTVSSSAIYSSSLNYDYVYAYFEDSSRPSGFSSTAFSSNYYYDTFSYNHYDYYDSTNGVYYSIRGNNEVTAIRDNPSFTYVTIPDTVTISGTTYKVTEIGPRAFFANTYVETVVIGNNVKKIGKSAFAGCSYLEQLTIGEGVTDISDYAFSQCTHIITVNYNAICANDLSANNQVFYQLGYNTSSSYYVNITIGKKVQRIPSYLFNPYNSTSTNFGACIDSVTFESGSVCKEIGAYAFAYCSLLSNITIPSTVQKIEEYAFYYCNNMSYIIFADDNDYWRVTDPIYGYSYTGIDVSDEYDNESNLTSYYCSYVWEKQ